MNETLYSLTNSLLPHPPAPGSNYSIFWFFEFDNSICNKIIDLFFLCLPFSTFWIALLVASKFMNIFSYVISNQFKKYPLNISHQLVRF